MSPLATQIDMKNFRVLQSKTKSVQLFRKFMRETSRILMRCNIFFTLIPRAAAGGSNRHKIFRKKIKACNCLNADPLKYDFHAAPTF